MENQDFHQSERMNNMPESVEVKALVIDSEDERELPTTIQTRHESNSMSILTKRLDGSDADKVQDTQNIHACYGGIIPSLQQVPNRSSYRNKNSSPHLGTKG